MNAKHAWVAAAAVVLFVAWAAAGATITWTNPTVLGGGNFNIDDPNNWVTPVGVHVIPGSGDDANITIVGLTDSNWIFVTASATFNPDGYLRYSHSAVVRPLVSLKDLTLSKGLILDFGTTSGASSGDQFRMGDATTAATLNLTGNSPFTFKNQAGWGSIDLVNAGSAINLSGDNIVITTGPAGTASGNSTGSLLGGVVQANETTAGSTMSFTNSGGTITLQAASARAGGTMALGYVRLAVRSDQTWICDANGFVSRNYQEGLTTAGPFLVKSIDGAPLNNLGQVNFVLTGTVSTSSTATTAMQLAPGIYGSLDWQGMSTSNRDNHLKMTGDANFNGLAVIPGSGTAVAFHSDLYGVIIQSQFGTNFSNKYLRLEGHVLGITNGLELVDNKTQSYVYAAVSSTPLARIDGNAGSVTIGGDVLFYSQYWGADSRTRFFNNDPNANMQGMATQATGIDGGYEGVKLSIGGNFGMNTRALTGGTGYGLSRSTVTMLGGTPGSPVTFEVGDSDANFKVQKNSFSLGKLVIGATGDSAYVRLVNNYLNENSRSAVFGDDPAVKKTGEKLITNLLSIVNASTLDMDGQVAEANSLQISLDSWLDLHTGATLADGSIVTNFYALGDQTADWLTVESRVEDTSNAGTTFQPYFSVTDGRTYWQAVIPEPATIALLIGGAAAGLIRRRRKS